MKTESVSNVSNNLNSTKFNMPSKLPFDGRFVPEVNYTNVTDTKFSEPISTSEHEVANREAASP